MFALGILSYRIDMDVRLVNALRTVATNITSRPQLLEAATLLPKDNFNLLQGHSLGSKELEYIAERYCLSFESSPQAQLLRNYGETSEDAAVRRKEAYDILRRTQCRSLAEELSKQWPSHVAELPDDFANYDLIDQWSFEDEVQNLFKSKFLNLRLFEHAEQLQSALDAIPYCSATYQVAPIAPTLNTLRRPYEPLSLFHLVKSNERLTSGSLTRELLLRLSTRNPEGRGIPYKYIVDLGRCVDALETRPTLPAHTIRTALLPRTVAEGVLLSAGLWPSLGPESLLNLLSLHFRQKIHVDWKEALISYAEGLAADQREARIAAAQRTGLKAEAIKETANVGGEGWEAAKYLDWLLIQLDGNFLIRPLQASIAHEMMSPRGKKNTVMQLNMGEGKSSVGIVTHPCLFFY